MLPDVSIQSKNFIDNINKWISHRFLLRFPDAHCYPHQVCLF